MAASEPYAGGLPSCYYQKEQKLAKGPERVNGYLIGDSNFLNLDLELPKLGSVLLTCASWGFNGFTSSDGLAIVKSSASVCNPMHFAFRIITLGTNNLKTQADVSDWKAKYKSDLEGITNKFLERKEMRFILISHVPPIFCDDPPYKQSDVIKANQIIEEVCKSLPKTYSIALQEEFEMAGRTLHQDNVHLNPAGLKVIKRIYRKAVIAQFTALGPSK